MEIPTTCRQAVDALECAAPSLVWVFERAARAAARECDGEVLLKPQHVKNSRPGICTTINCTRILSRTAVEFRPITLEQRRWVRQQQRTQEPRRRLG